MRVPLVLALLWLVALLPAAHASTNYCELSCGHTTHTVCKRMWKCGPEPDCMPIPGDHDFRRYMEKAHNRLRDRAAGGDSIFKKLPTAANMNSLVYDKELEYIAMCWANTCPLGLDPCAITKAYQQVNQIKYVSKSPVNTKTEIYRMVYSWYKEKIYLDEETVRRYVPDNKTKHVSQLLWARTRYFGCSRVRNASGVYLIFCNYAMGGQRSGEAIYKVGVPLSNCFKIYPPCEVYKNLCGYLFDDSLAVIVRPMSPTLLVLGLYLGYRLAPRLRATCGTAKLVLE